MKCWLATSVWITRGSFLGKGIEAEMAMTDVYNDEGEEHSYLKGPKVGPCLPCLQENKQPAWWRAEGRGGGMVS